MHGTSAANWQAEGSSDQVAPIIDHMANRVASVEFGEHYVRCPIPASPHIHIGNALTEDWGGVLPAEQATYVFENPPFLGQKAMPVATWPHLSEPVAGKLYVPAVQRQVTGVTPGRGLAALP